MQRSQDLNPSILLASLSPRRKELLEKAGFQVSPIPPGPESRAEPGEDPRTFVLRQAKSKALGARFQGESGVLMSGDTVVTLDGRILGKPQMAQDARDMLCDLMGRTHEVWTAIAVGRVERGRILEESLRLGASCSRVRFGQIPELLLAAYLKGEEWRDKAGGYGIQGWASQFAEVVEGSLDNVIGLPVELFQRLLGEVQAQ